MNKLDAAPRHRASTSRPRRCPRRCRGSRPSTASIDLTIDRPGLHAERDVVRGAAAARDVHRGRRRDRGGQRALPGDRLRQAAVRAEAERDGRRRQGQIAKNTHPPLTVTIQQADGQAAMSKTVVSLPAGMGVDLKNLGSVCTDAQLNAGACPAGSKIGTVTAQHAAAAGRAQRRGVPDAGRQAGRAARDRARPRADPAARARSRSATRLVTTFDGIPDVPLTKLMLNLSGGPKGALSTANDLCTTTPTVEAQYGAHSGATGQGDGRRRRSSGAPPLSASRASSRASRQAADAVADGDVDQGAQGRAGQAAERAQARRRPRRSRSPAACCSAASATRRPA